VAVESLENRFDTVPTIEDFLLFMTTVITNNKMKPGLSFNFRNQPALMMHSASLMSKTAKLKVEKFSRESLSSQPYSHRLTITPTPDK
jgi:hypothetical protein